MPAPDEGHQVADTETAVELFGTHLSQSGPDYGLGLSHFQVKAFTIIEVVPSPLDSCVCQLVTQGYLAHKKHPPPLGPP